MRIISGGQTGIDEMGLQVAKELGLLTGGFMPKDYKTETGNKPEFVELYGMKEHPSSDYNARTELNIQLSGGTIIFGDISSPGSKSALKFLKKHQKPYIANPTVEEIKEFIKYQEVVNIAGNRASKVKPEDLEKYRNTLKEGLS